MLRTVLTLLAVPAIAAAAPYPTNVCVGSKLTAAATQCAAAFRAWARWEVRQDDTARDAALADAGARLARSWDRAESRSARSAVDCAATTATAGDMQSQIEAAVAATVGTVNAGLDLGTASDARCGARLLRAAAGRCKRVLQAEGIHIRLLESDPAGARRMQLRDRATSRFAAAFGRVTSRGCPTTATLPDAETALATLEGDAVTSTIVSPNVPQGVWTQIDPPTEVEYLGRTLEPICSRGTPYAYFVRRGTVNKLVMYYQGGGACWDHDTCHEFTGAFDDDVTPSDNPANFTAGFGDLTNPENPIRDWNAVFVSYCTGDVHWGDAFQSYARFTSVVPIEHRGFINASVAEKFAREHFVNPDEVLVTGSSAGAYGAILHSLYLQHRTYPASRFTVLADAGNGVITQDFLENQISHWGIEANLPAWIPALNVPLSQLSADQLWIAGAATYPNTRFGQYTTAYDGGLGSQTFFLQVMQNLGNFPAWLNWWQASCDWNSGMRAIAQNTAAGAPNYRYYIGPGSRHTMYGSNKVYTDTIGGVPTIVSWLNAMLGDGVGWDNVECAPCDLLPGTCSVGGTQCWVDGDCGAGACQGADATPDPLQAPFGPNGVITCP